MCEVLHSTGNVRVKEILYCLRSGLERNKKQRDRKHVAETKEMKETQMWHGLYKGVVAEVKSPQHAQYIDGSG
jgi:hypothetical protein